MYWALASQNFAKHVSGRVRSLTMARDNGDPAYRRNSYFGMYELPSMVQGEAILNRNPNSKPKP